MLANSFSIQGNISKVSEPTKTFLLTIFLNFSEYVEHLFTLSFCNTLHEKSKVCTLLLTVNQHKSTNLC